MADGELFVSVAVTVPSGAQTAPVTGVALPPSTGSAVGPPQKGS